ncbi:Wzy polymerase domain-containing protein [Erwinia sp. MYb375]|uniref:PglL family O-oligosaccharyltransferase n=2 Tax=Erwinia TaxID=551 RepID=UPI0030A04EA7
MNCKLRVLNVGKLGGISWLPLYLLIIWFGFLSHLYLPNMGGSGLKLPQNIITWAVIAALVSTIWLTFPSDKAVRLTTASRLIFVSIAILGIPLFFTSPQWQDVARLRWLGLLGGGVFYVSCLQLSTRCFYRFSLYYILLIAIVFQALIALLQFTIPEAVPAWLAYPQSWGRPYGVFQQVNVLASFIATGLALAIMLLLLPGFILDNIKRERLRLCALGLILLIFPALLVWLQSRVGWLGGAISDVLLLIIGAKAAPKKNLIAAGLMGASIVLAIAVQWSGHITDVAHTGSNFARMAILKSTLSMIAERPWTGWGYGSFEYNFQHYRLTQGFSTLETKVVSHPHNEILLWCVEGGVIAFIGLSLLVYVGGDMVWRAWRPTRQLNEYQTGLNRGLSCALLPILLHTQTEFPFSLSTAHWAIFILLLAKLDSDITPTARYYSLSAATTAFLRKALPVFSITILLLAGIALYANLSLTSLERNRFLNAEPARRAMAFDPGVNTERWHYDQQIHALLMFNQTRDPALLEGYVRWADSYLSRRIDKNVYASWLSIAHYQQDAITYQRLRREAHALFPEDERFMVHLQEGIK